MTGYAWAEPYGPLRVGRVTVTCPWEVSTKTNAATRVVTLSGQSAANTFQPLTQPEIRAQAESLLSYAGQTVPVTFSGFPHLDGWYTVGAPGADESTWRDFTSIEWAVDLTLVGRSGSVEVESRLVGGNRVHASSAVAELWHAPAVGATGYQAGSGAPGYVDRVGASGTVRVFRGIPGGTNPRWASPLATALSGAAQVTVASDVLTGTYCADSPADWSIDNGLLRVQPRTAAGTFLVSSYLTSGWGTAKVFDVKRNGVSLGAATNVTVIRNDPCECVLRLTWDHAPGRSTVDLGVKRGARHVALTCQQSNVTGPWRVDDNAFGGTVSDQLSAAGYITTTSDDADGNRWLIGATAASAAAGGFGLAASSPAAVLAGFIGVVRGGASAVAGDTAPVVNAQYLGTPGEVERVITR